MLYRKRSVSVRSKNMAGKKKVAPKAQSKTDKSKSKDKAEKVSKEKKVPEAKDESYVVSTKQIKDALNRAAKTAQDEIIQELLDAQS